MQTLGPHLVLRNWNLHLTGFPGALTAGKFCEALSQGITWFPPWNALCERGKCESSIYLLSLAIMNFVMEIHHSGLNFF